MNNTDLINYDLFYIKNKYTYLPLKNIYSDLN